MSRLSLSSKVLLGIVLGILLGLFLVKKLASCRFWVIFLFLLLLIEMFYLFVLPLAFPAWGSGSFYSSDFITKPLWT